MDKIRRISSSRDPAWDLSTGSTKLGAEMKQTSRSCGESYSRPGGTASGTRGEMTDAARGRVLRTAGDTAGHSE